MIYTIMWPYGDLLGAQAGSQISQKMVFWWTLFAEIGKKLNFWSFLRIFCIPTFDQNKRCKCFVSVIRENGCMIPTS